MECVVSGLSPSRAFRESEKRIGLIIVLERLDIFLAQIGRHNDSVSPPGELRIIFPRTFLYLLDGLLLALLPMGTVFVDSADMEDSLMRMLSITSADASNGLIMRHGGPASSRIATQHLFTSRGLSNAESTARPGKGDYSAAFWVSTRNGWAG